MDRPEPGLVKWSPNAALDSFLHINLQHRIVQLYEPTGRAQRGKFEYNKVAKHDDFPPLTTYDWSPSVPGLVAVGTSTGVVNLLRVDDNSNAYMELGLKMSRTCQAVAFNTTGLLAVGLDRVRSDQCLHIWDVNRLSHVDSFTPGFSTGVEPFTEPTRRLEASMSISSVRFFEDNPQTLVVGIKAQGLRIHDLRDDSPGVINFQTKCNNNLAIDYADQNYFASSALDQPGVMVWDRRATQRPVASPSYLDALDADDLPWGGALRLDRAMEMESDPQSDRNSLIRALRYCRDHRGMLAILSRTGQLKVLSTQTEFTPSDMETVDSPELLHVRKSHEMDNFYSDSNRKNDRIVSFDWVNMGSPALRPRLIVLRASGAFDILEIPSFTRTYPYKLTPWQAPYRGLAEGSRYHSIMDFEQSQISETLGPLFVEDALADIPVFGPEKADISPLVQDALQSHILEEDLLVDREASDKPLPKSFFESSTIAEKLQSLREYARETLGKENDRKETSEKVTEKGIVKGVDALSLGPPSNRELHEELLKKTMDTRGFPKEAQMVLDHVMLLRAKEKYLFDSETNRRILADDVWLRDVWDWIGGAEKAMLDEGMFSHPLDLSYMGVFTIWTDDLGKRPSARLRDGTTSPDVPVWERCINSINKKRGIPKFDGADTKKPHHRGLCLDICGWGRPRDWDAESLADSEVSKKPSKWHTRATAYALFRGDPKAAVRILKRASTAYPELLFVSLALQLIGKGDRKFAAEQLDFDEAVASKTDPYLRAISSLIATGDWATIANQKSLPLRDRAFVAIRNLDDDQLTRWLKAEVTEAIKTGDIEGIILTGITDKMVDILAKYVEKFHDVQSAILIMSICAPRFIDDHRCTAWRNAYRAYLQRHKAFFQRTKFEVESTKKSKPDANGRPVIKPPFRQIALRCVYCDAETTLRSGTGGSNTAAGGISGPFTANPLADKGPNTGISCPNCKRHLPRCVVCLEVVGIARSDKPETSNDPEVRLAAKFPTFCLKCEHVLHLDHARQWFARHVECPVPECRCKCNFRANPELNYH